MSERMDSPEGPSEFTRDEVVEAFRKFAEKGATDPADLDPTDPEVIKANNIHQAWVKQEEQKAEQAGTEEARLQMSLELTPVFVDAGFSDKEYLEDIANDWLSQDLWAAEEVGLIEVAARIQSKINEINEKIKQ